MTAAASLDQVRLIRSWAEDTAPGQIRACASADALADWIVRSRYQLADMDRLAPSLRPALQVAISTRFQEVGQ